MASALHGNDFDPIDASREIDERYRRYLRTMFYFRDRDLRASFEKALDKWELAHGPYLEATPVYRRGRPASEVLADILGAKLDPGFAQAAGGDRPLFSHQEQAIRRLAEGRNIVVATGTGSGKTEAYLLPILLRLLQEQSTGERPVGVRALILYPMNALANDQRRRLAEFQQDLEKHGSAFRFTFGRYTGDSPEDAKDDYRNARRQLDGRLPGELVLRQEMRERPPDILLTNYSMLEYLLLRPKETSLFDNRRGATWRFLVLDEAHQYKGAKGMEIAMLLRRLKQRLRDGGQKAGFQCIATSASLGRGPSDRKALASFAAELFGEPFEAEDILTGEVVPVEPVESAAFTINIQALQALADAVRNQEAARAASILSELEGRAPVVKERTGSIEGEGRLHAFLRRESRALQLRHLLQQSPREVTEVGNSLFPDAPANERPHLVAALVDLLVRAKDPESNSPLISCRYHLFVRGLEGAFIRYVPRREVSLTRGLGEGDGGTWFEVALCRECGQHYLVGRRVDDRLDEALRDEAEVDYMIEFYRPLEGSNGLEVDGNGRIVHLCTQCGAMSRGPSASRNPSCGHAAILRLVREEERTSHGDQVSRCGRCGYRAPDPVREIVHGTDGPNAVIATTLHQLLPEVRRKVLAFADGRQDAAFFAWYLEDTYESIHSRVLVFQALRKIAKTGDAEVGLHELALEVRELLRTERPNETYTDREWLQKVWVHVFRELLTDQPRISLEGVGLVQWRVCLPQDLRLPESLSQPPWNCTRTQAGQIVGFVLDSMRTDGAVELEPGDSIRVQWDDLGLSARQTQMAIGGSGSTKAWDGEKSRRVVFLKRWLERHAGSGLTAQERLSATQGLLRELWEVLSTYPGPPRVLLRAGSGRRAHPRWWRARLLRPDDPVFVCQVCGRLHVESIGGLCTRYGCAGELKSIDPEKALVYDYYRMLYQLPLPPALRTEEHTAQLDHEKAREFQEDFEQGRIHLLSCSTTFELGIDLGDLDTIFLRNAPPEPFNYAQRVGRAGRRAGHPGFAVTYCRRRPHDQAAFGDPSPLLAGKAKPPTLALTNQKIVLRHLVALALSEFFKANQNRFENVKTFLGDMAAPSIAKDLQTFLLSRRAEIERRLDAVVPESLKSTIGLSDGTWVKHVTGKDTAFERAVAEVVSDYQQVDRLQQQYVAAEDFRDAEWTRKRKETIADEDVISFLSRKAVIPKYGFPVDVVELDVQRTRSGPASTVALERDLAIAVAEFAPSSQVVANKGVWTSRGLKRVVGKAWGRFRYRRCRHCGTFETWREGEEPSGAACCGHAYTGTWVDPIFGFVADRDGGKAPKGRPRRLFSSRPYFSRLAVPEGDPEVVGRIAQIWRVSPGHLVVLCEGRKGRGFRICSDCGAGSEGTVAPHPHGSPTGGQCSGTLETVVLGHEFVTDVLRVRFTRDPSQVEPCDRYWFYHSIAYALVEGAATLLEVPRQDLNVTVRTAPDSRHEIVLYDAVPGGAGLVAGLQDSDTFREVLREAHARVDQCRGCGWDASCYGCLRHYGNQFAHPRLKRGPAASFLAEVLKAW